MFAYSGAVDKDQFEGDGFVIARRLLDTALIPDLHQAFDDLFDGRFETGVRPDEVNWQSHTSDPTLTRQICNGWKADRRIARVVFDPSLAEAIGKLAGWSGVRLMIDNVIWKPPGTKSLGFHQDNAYLHWFSPGEITTCWIALDETSAAGGTIEFAKGSHRWGLHESTGEFHAPEDYRHSLMEAASACGQSVDIHAVEVSPGGGSFHHGMTWHGSGPNRGSTPRRALVIHAMRDTAEFVPENLGQGIGPIYGRYRRLADNRMDENQFPVLWRQDGYRTPGIDTYLAD